jgi:ribosomal protein S12 methylthiotransferase accessory factor
VAIQALNELTKDADARRIRLIVPTVFPAERITGKLALASAAVFSRHRCITLDSLPPAQVGRGRSPRHAARVAIAESIERLCGQSAPTQAISGVSARQLGRVIPMQRFPIHAAHASTHSGLGKYDPDMPLDWVSTYSLSGQETFAPIDLVYYGAGVRRSNRPPIFFASSSGTAAHTDPHEAREAALIELVERDALMVCWASKMTPVLLSHAVVPTSARAVLANIDSAGYEVILRDITLDLLPVCLALARNRSHASPYVMCGAGCARRMEDAASKALCELETLLWHALGRKDGVPIAATAVKTPIDHAQFYCEPENARHIDFLLTDRPPARPRPSRDEIDKQPLSDFFSNKRFELFYCDITSDEVRETTNLVVYRVLATDLIPITFGFGMEITEGKRFDYVADRPGANRRLTAPSAPHFFS